MIVGLPKEIKNNEFRVGLTPGAAGEYVQHSVRGKGRWPWRGL